MEGGALERTLGLPKAGSPSSLGGSISSRQSQASRNSKWGAARTSDLSFRGVGGLSTSYFLEKQAVVIDFGHAFSKVGFASESRPRHIFSSPELRARCQNSKSLSSSISKEEWIEILEKLMTKIYFHYLSVSPKDRRVVVCDPVFSSEQFRSALAFVLFERLVVPSVAFVIDLVLPLYLTGLSSGIVIDLGYESSRVLATFAGVPILSAYSSADSGARRIQARLRKSLQADGGVLPEWLEDEAIVEDIMVRSCYVRCDRPELTLRTGLAGSFPHPHRQNELLSIPANCRWQPNEILFDGSIADEDVGDLGDSCSSFCVVDAFVQTLERCPNDVRAAVVQNIIVCGGCAAIRGLLPRLALELHAALKAQPHMAVLADRLRFTPLDFSPICAVWTGGAVLGAFEAGLGDFTKDDYEKGEKPLPDWVKECFA